MSDETKQPPAVVALPTAEELRAHLDRMLPPEDQRGEMIEQVGERQVSLRLPLKHDYVRHGVFSGPVMLGFADTAMYSAVHAACGLGGLALLVTVNVTFLNAAPACDLLAVARVLRRSRRMAMCEVRVSAAGGDEPVCHATATYVLKDFAH